jgi:hypothetical protein
MLTISVRSSQVSVEVQKNNKQANPAPPPELLVLLTFHRIPITRIVYLGDRFLSNNNSEFGIH